MGPLLPFALLTHKTSATLFIKVEILNQVQNDTLSCACVFSQVKTVHRYSGIFPLRGLRFGSRLVCSTANARMILVRASAGSIISSMEPFVAA